MSFRILDECPNVVLLGAFFKVYDLANLRVGFALAQEELATAIHKTCPPFAVSGVAKSAAIARWSSRRRTIAWWMWSAGRVLRKGVSAGYEEFTEPRYPFTRCDPKSLLSEIMSGRLASARCW